MGEMEHGGSGAPSFRAAYREMMEEIRVTPDVRGRVLAGVREARPKRNASRIWPVLAAAAALVLAALVVLPGIRQGGTGNTTPGEESLSGNFSVEEEESLKALSDAAGFSVPDLSGLPFSVADTAYNWYSDGMAEISWTGTGGESGTFRMAGGTEDVSGDYTDYAAQAVVTLFGQQVTLSGDGDGTYVLARWTDGTYAYSISLTDSAGNGYSLAEWQGLTLQ
ncbi:MAG: hypothetical protein ACI4OJ_00405 [Lachnospiraceae bacterium]